jgi:DNA-binding NtrC family response regulator
VRASHFREDLYYRLNVIHVHVPRLVERAGDIPLLVSAFLNKFCARNGVALKRFSQEAMKCLMRYSWPGNVRELRNVIESMVVLNTRGASRSRTCLPTFFEAGSPKSEPRRRRKRPRANHSPTHQCHDRRPFHWDLLAEAAPRLPRTRRPHNAACLQQMVTKCLTLSARLPYSEPTNRLDFR